MVLAWSLNGKDVEVVVLMGLAWFLNGKDVEVEVSDGLSLVSEW